MAGRQCGTRSRLRSNNPQMIMPMATPPHRIGADDRVAPFMSQRAQPSETAMERMAQRVVGSIVTMGQWSGGARTWRLILTQAWNQESLKDGPPNSSFFRAPA